MVCEEARKLNKDFIEGSLESKKLAEYIKHIESCRNCYEELDITYIVTLGLDGIENDTISIFNFPSIIAKRIEEAKLYIRLKKNRAKMTNILSALSYGLLTICIILFFGQLN